MWKDERLPRSSLGRSGRIALALAAAIIFYQIMLPPPIGLANNGDFGKLLGRFNLGARVDDPQDAFFKYVHIRYTFAPEFHWDSRFVSSEMLLV